MNTLGMLTSSLATKSIVIMSPAFAHRGSSYVYWTWLSSTADAAVTPRVTVLSELIVAVIDGCVVSDCRTKAAPAELGFPARSVKRC
jgi:hypothetical protein